MPEAKGHPHALTRAPNGTGRARRCSTRRCGDGGISGSDQAMYLTHGSRAGSVEGFGDRDGRRGARGTEDHREVRGIGDSSESLVGSDPGDISIGPALTILRVASHLTADRTSMSAQSSGDRSLVVSLFSERRERISLTRGELAIPVHELPPFRREGRSRASQLASTLIGGAVGRVVALTI